MGKLLVSIKDEALVDIEVAYEWYQLESFGAGPRFKEEVKLFTQKISDYPYNYPFLKYLQPIRKIRLKHFSYYIYYIISENTINILAVIHTSRSDRFIRKRLK